ncbi:MAG: presenilin family intramembrane aspartyl protease PSH [Thermoplasmata archaeon]
MRGVRSFGLVGLYIGAQIVALLLAVPFKSAGLASTSNPNSPLDPLFIIVVIVAAPLAILWISRRSGGLSVLRGLILCAIAGSLFFTLYATFSLFFPAPFYFPPAEAGQVGDLALPVAGMVSVALLLALWMEPQWYVIDTVGFLAAGSLIALLGISFGILPTFILLIALAVYDAIAVYRTKHMISLANVVTELKLPILMVMPTAAGFDYTKSGGLSEHMGQPVEEREAMFMGLGDVVIPGILIVSAFVWVSSKPLFAGIGANAWTAFGALVGSLIGYAILMHFVNRGNAQAGLPLLNGGALVGYILTYVLLFHNLGLGLTLSL